MQILAHATALPGYRLSAAAIKSAWGSAPRGLVSKPVCGFDEDAVTLGIEAARAVLGSAAPRALFLGATTLPYEEKPSVADLAAALGGARGLSAFEIRGSAQAGLQALWMAGLHADATGEATLAVLADAPMGPEDSALGQACGAGAAAFLLGPGDGIARIGGLSGASHPALGHRFRRQGSERLSDLELRSDPAGEALSALDLQPAGHLLGALAPRLEARLAKRLGARGDGLWPRLGDTGAAGAGLALSHWLSDAAEGAEALCIAVGGGALSLRVTALRPGEGPGLDPALETARELDVLSYLRHRRVLGRGAGA